MSRGRASRRDVDALVERIDEYAHELGLLHEGQHLHFQKGSAANGQPHYLYVERSTDSGRQRTHLPDFAPEFHYRVTLSEAFTILTATADALGAVVNHQAK
ncbi:hypothetical protein SEA_RIZWANA_95 [Arthrobacter phage Rizwana]|nr:hypothetical protein SEA_RIZWANA_95 [Arthrobacter phage Rizwana]